MKRAAQEVRAGLVVASVGIEAEVEIDGAAAVRCAQPRGKEYAVVGDRVEVGGEVEIAGRAVARISRVLPRSRTLCRPSKGRIQLIAANIDRLVVVSAVDPPLRPGLIDRYLVAAESQGIEAILALNKADLDVDGATAARLVPYERLGYRTLVVSAARGDGLDELRTLLGEGLSVLAGHSGVGKSSVLKALFPNEEIIIGDLSEASGRGRHTTTVAIAYRLGAGHVVDTPGIREFGLAEVNEEQLRDAFREFRALAPTCRFGNCRHLAEPGCAVRAAVESGAISAERYASYLQLRDELLGGG